MVRSDFTAKRLLLRSVRQHSRISYAALLYAQRILHGDVVAEADLAAPSNRRFKRIFLPLVIGCFTIIPAMWAVSYFVSRPSPGSSESSPLFTAVVSGDIELVRSELQNPDNGIDALDSNSSDIAAADGGVHWTHRNCRIVSQCGCQCESA